MIDIVEGHILIGCSRLINALLLIVCIAVGLSATLMIVKKQFAMIAVDILFDGLRSAAVAAIGFGGDFRSSGAGISYIALLAAVGHALAFLPMSYAGIDIATASLCAAVVIGFLAAFGWDGYSLSDDRALHSGPAASMVPYLCLQDGLALIMFLQSLNDPGQGLEYMQQFF